MKTTKEGKSKRFSAAYLGAIASALALTVQSSFALEIKGFNLTESDGHLYDANVNGEGKTEAQEAVDYLYSIGVRHVVLNPIATMPSGNASLIVPATRPGARRGERERYVRLSQYIHSLGMTVGIRPIILLDTAVASRDAWHGNIKPNNPGAWFKSLRSYLEGYANVALDAKAEEFTVGAELYSMTVGLEDQWPEKKFGFVPDWIEIVSWLKGKLGPQVRLMYDINFTDVSNNSDGRGASGGEIERWRNRLVTFKPKAGASAQEVLAWNQVKELWSMFDYVGIDIYRSLIANGDAIPANYQELVSTLQARAEEYASDLDAKLEEIKRAVGFEKKIIIKELGFKSCTNCFVDPFVYDDPRLEVNIAHQAAAYEAVFKAFVAQDWPWLAGIAFWDVGVNRGRSGKTDPGFTPRGKEMTEEVIRKGWGS